VYQNINTTNSNIKFFLPDVERWTLLIDHSMDAVNSKIKRTGKNIDGIIIGQDGKQLNFNSAALGTQVGVAGQYDILSIGQILMASGIESMDQIFPGSCVETLRSSGVVIIINIYYNNIRFNTGTITYQYRADPVITSEFKSVQTTENIVIDNTTSGRVIINRHGIRLVFVQGGKIGVFDFQTLLLTFVSGLGLLAVATLITDQVALRLLPQRAVYQQYKYEPTPDFSEMRSTELKEKKEKKTKQFNRNILD